MSFIFIIHLFFKTAIIVLFLLFFIYFYDIYFCPLFSLSSLSSYSQDIYYCLYFFIYYRFVKKTTENHRDCFQLASDFGIFTHIYTFLPLLIPSYHQSLPYFRFLQTFTNTFPLYFILLPCTFLHSSSLLFLAFFVFLKLFKFFHPFTQSSNPNLFFLHGF